MSFHAFTESRLACLWLVSIGSPSTTVPFADASAAVNGLMWLQPKAAFSGLCSGFCTNSFCSSLMLIQRPRRSVFLRAVQTATSSSSKLSSACISTLIGVLKELPRISPLSTPVCFFFSCVFERLNICIFTVGFIQGFVLSKSLEPFGDHFFCLLNSCTGFLHAAVRMISKWLRSDIQYV